MLRVTGSTISFGVTAVDAKASSAIPNLNDFIDSNVSVHPVAMKLVDSPPGDLVVSEIVVRAAKNPEKAHRIYKGPDVGLQTALAAFARRALKHVAMTPYHFISDHGVEIEFTYKNPTTAFNNALLLWDIHTIVE